MSAPRPQFPPERVWWVIWFALLTAPFMVTLVLKTTPSGNSAFPLPWQIALIPFLIASAIRWAVLPKLHNGAVAFPLFVVGLAMSESLTYLGIFLFPDVRQELFALSVLGIAQFVPTFAKRFFASE
jgi:cytochrome bd-type quinol oxidase subunit 2